MPTPRISVVVSSYERPAGLERLLAALAAQTLGPDQFEVIAVDNGSGPATAEVLSRAAAELDLQLRTVRNEHTLGPAGGRNSGWRLARAAWVAFTDDDCRPVPDWLEQLLAAADAAIAAGADPQRLIVQGRVEPEPAQLAATRRTLFTRIVAVHAADGRYETSNILYRRALLTELNGFDESFVPRGIRARPVGEDTDLGWRAHKLGARAHFAPAALVHHEITALGPLGKLQDATRWAGAAHIFAAHPEARAFLFRRYFWNVWHYMLWRALALLVLPAPRWLARLIIARYLRALTLRARETGAGAWAVPYLIAEDATEAAVLVLASLRERTPVL